MPTGCVDNIESLDYFECWLMLEFLRRYISRNEKNLGIK